MCYRNIDAYPPHHSHKLNILYETTLINLYTLNMTLYITCTCTCNYCCTHYALCPCSARERHARGLIYPNGLSSARIHSTRIRLVVFRDDKGVKQQLFDSQSNAENNEVSIIATRCTGAMFALYVHVHVCTYQIVFG